MCLSQVTMKYFTGCLDTSTILWRPKHFFPTGGSLGDFQAGRCVGGLGTGYEETWHSHLAGLGILLMPLWDRREPRVPPGSLTFPEKLLGPKRKGSSSNHHFCRGKHLNFEGVDVAQVLLIVHDLRMHTSLLQKRWDSPSFKCCRVLTIKSITSKETEGFRHFFSEKTLWVQCFGMFSIGFGEILWQLAPAIALQGSTVGAQIYSKLCECLLRNFDNFGPLAEGIYLAYRAKHINTSVLPGVYTSSCLCRCVATFPKEPLEI